MNTFSQSAPCLGLDHELPHKFSVICFCDKTVSSVCTVRCTLCGDLTLPRAEVCWLCRYRKNPHLESFFSKERAIRIQAQEVLGRRHTDSRTNSEHKTFIFINALISYWALATLVLESSFKVYLTAVKTSSLNIKSFTKNILIWYHRPLSSGFVF